jgi:galactokinase/mevalonate kinase-like predicted kinase
MDTAERANPGYFLSIPARINILGNPTDANEGDFATISAAVNLRAYAMIEPAAGWVFEMIDPEMANDPVLFSAKPAEIKKSIITNEDRLVNGRFEFTPDSLPLPCQGQFALLNAALNRLYQYSPELREKMHLQGLRLYAWSAVPRQSGLGGSTLFVLLALASLREFYTLDTRVHNDYVLSELAQRVESLELGITCGFADRYVPLFGGIAYLDYRGKLYHRPIGSEPYVSYERLDRWVGSLPLVAITTGITHDSGDVHGRMRPRYLRDHEEWIAHGGPIPQIVQLMQAAWETAWRGKIALLEGDLPGFGDLMNVNHRLVDSMMTLCGFKDGAGWANNLLIEVALQAGAFGAKLTGAGSGGSVFALIRPGEQRKLAASWERAAAKAGLNEARVFFPKISHKGLVVQPLDSD